MDNIVLQPSCRITNGTGCSVFWVGVLRFLWSRGCNLFLPEWMTKGDHMHILTKIKQ